jgi:hypothetical protein
MPIPLNLRILGFDLEAVESFHPGGFHDDNALFRIDHCRNHARVLGELQNTILVATELRAAFDLSLLLRDHGLLQLRERHPRRNAEERERRPVSSWLGAHDKHCRNADDDDDECDLETADAESFGRQGTGTLCDLEKHVGGDECRVHCHDDHRASQAIAKIAGSRHFARQARGCDF